MVKQARIRVVAPDQLSLKVLDLPMEFLRVNPHQPRQHMNEAGIKELANSIKKHGLLQPITVTKDKRNKDGYMVVAGERRFRAYQLIEKKLIPAVLTSGNPDEIALIENLQREDLTPLEEAEALARLKKKYKYSNVELGSVIGKSRPTVSEILKLNELPRKIKEESRLTDATKTLLLQVAKVTDKKEQLKLWSDIKRGGYSVRQAKLKKQAPELQKDTLTKRTLSTGKRFISELERMSSDSPLTPDKYDELLEMYQRFTTYVKEEAKRQKTAKT